MIFQSIFSWVQESAKFAFEFDLKKNNIFLTFLFLHQKIL